MLRLKTDLKVKSRVVLKCDRHIRYNPENDGQGGIKGSCPTCYEMLEVYQTRQRLMSALREFEQRVKPFETYKSPKHVKSTESSSELDKAFEVLLPKT